MDWDALGVNAHGVSKSARLRGYLAVLSLNGRQQTFGPFTISRQEAASAHDRLAKYFLPFLKKNFKPNCPSEVFFGYDDAETQADYGANRLLKLKRTLQNELETQGLDVENLTRIHTAQISANFSAKVAASRAQSQIDASRRSGVVSLERKLIRLSESHEILEDVISIAVPAERREEVNSCVARVEASYADLKMTLGLLVESCKSSIGIDPQQMIK